MSNIKSKFETKCKYFKDCHLGKNDTCEGCNVYLYTHDFYNLVIKLQNRQYSPKEVRKFLNYFNSLILT